MKQFNFVVEVAVDGDGSTTILIRAINGQILKVTKDPSDVASFLSQTLENLKSSPANNA